MRAPQERRPLPLLRSRSSRGTWCENAADCGIRGRIGQGRKSRWRFPIGGWPLYTSARTGNRHALRGVPRPQRRLLDKDHWLMHGLATTRTVGPPPTELHSRCVARCLAVPSESTDITRVTAVSPVVEFQASAHGTPSSTLAPLRRSKMWSRSGKEARRRGKLHDVFVACLRRSAGRKGHILSTKADEVTLKPAAPVRLACIPVPRPYRARRERHTTFDGSRPDSFASPTCRTLIYRHGRWA